MRRPLPSAARTRSSATPERSTTWAGLSRPFFIWGRRSVPPATSLAPGGVAGENLQAVIQAVRNREIKSSHAKSPIEGVSRSRPRADVTMPSGASSTSDRSDSPADAGAIRGIARCCDHRSAPLSDLTGEGFARPFRTSRAKGWLRIVLDHQLNPTRILFASESGGKGEAEGDPRGDAAAGDAIAILDHGPGATAAPISGSRSRTYQCEVAR